MTLSRRLSLLILLCLVPMIIAGLLTLASLYRQRSHELNRLARQQVELADADLLTVLDGARSLLTAVAEIPPGPDCGARLADLQHGVPAYSFLALVQPSGESPSAPTMCASPPEFRGIWSTRPDWLASIPAERGFHIGRYASFEVPAGHPAFPAGAFLPLALRLDVPDGGPERLVIAGLNLSWLAKHLAALAPTGKTPLAESSLTVVDGNGVVLVRLPEGDKGVGSGIGADVGQPAGQPNPPLATLTGSDRTSRRVTFSPASALPDGMAIAVGFDPTPFLSDVRDATMRGAALGVLATLMALTIGAVAGRRAIHRPVGRLLAAARRWSAGDLAARADLRGDRSEFGYLGDAFNQMAADIETRVAAHMQQAHQLEARVAERTRELSDTNNRLQVEIAERQRAETVLHQAQKLQAIGQLAGGLAHDFNNLLATILGSLELIERRVSTADDKLRALLTRAMDAVQRGSQLTSRLLAFSRRQRLAAQPTDVNRLVADLVTLAASTLGRRIRIQTDLAPDLWPAMADTSQLEAAILNLALNARDAMPDGGTLTLSTANETIGSDSTDPDPGDYVRISVQDTGIGMSRETLARAFEPFFTTKEFGKGSGLGLSQVYGLSRQSGGTIRVQSAPGRGTTIALLMPRARAVTAAAADATPPSRPQSRSAAELILLVDDDADVRQVSVDMLRDLGYEVAEAGDGEEALSLVQHLPKPPALLVLDYAMPGMNGLRLAASLRKLGITAPLLLATGYAELTDDQSGVRPDVVLHKPFSLAELDRTLVRLRTRAAAIA